MGSQFKVIFASFLQFVPLKTHQNKSNYSFVLGTILGAQMKPEINQQSIQISIEILLGFLIGSWRTLGGFWECFGHPGPSKMELSCGRGAIFEKITFFRSDAVLD